MPETPDWAGTPIAIGEQVLLQKAGTVAQNATVTWSAPVIRQQYSIVFTTFNQTSNAVVMPVSLVVQWVDQQTGTIVDVQKWCMFAGKNGTPHIVRGHGPTTGSIMQIVIGNNCAAADVLNYTLLVIEGTFNTTRHDLRTDDSGNVAYAGLTPCASDVIANIACIESAIGVGATASVDTTLPLVAGNVHVFVATTGAAGSGALNLQPQSDTDFPSGQILDQMFMPGAQSNSQNMMLPRTQCILEVHNATAGAVTMSAGVTVETVGG